LTFHTIQTGAENQWPASQVGPLPDYIQYMIQALQHSPYQQIITSVMKFAIIQILLLTLSLVSASVIPGAAWKQHNDINQEEHFWNATSMQEHASVAC